MTDIRLSIARPRAPAPLTTSTEPTTMPRESITDLANRILEKHVSHGVEVPIGDAARLACFVLDHADHLDFDSARPAKVEALGQGGNTDLTRRLEPMRPEPVSQIADSSETHA